jgi:hypothetical protein
MHGQTSRFSFLSISPDYRDDKLHDSIFERQESLKADARPVLRIVSIETILRLIEPPRYTFHDFQHPGCSLGELPGKSRKSMRNRIYGFTT